MLLGRAARTNRPIEPDCVFDGVGRTAIPKVPALLLTYDFYPVDNIVNFLTSLCMVTHVNTLFGVMQYILGASLADRLLHVLLAPLFYLLPYIAESLLYLWQFCCFMALPLIPLVAAGMLEFLSYEMNASIGAVATTSALKTIAVGSMDMVRSDQCVRGSR